MRGLKVVSLFSGIETGLLALIELGFKIDEYHTYEVLPEAIAVSKERFPFAIHHGSVVGADFTQFKGFDLVIGGSPCQNRSRTRQDDKNIKQGIKGDKSKLFWEFDRAVKEIHPKWFMLENVVSRDEDDDAAISEALGVKPTLINSNLFSAQERDRLFWTNIPIEELPKSSNLVLGDILETNVDEKYYYDKPFEIKDMNKRVCAKLIVNTHELLKSIYNPKFTCATITCISGGYQEKKVLVDGRVRKLTEIEYERLQTLPDNYTNVLVNGKKLSYSKRCSLCGNGWNKETVKHIFKGLLNT